MAGVSQALGLLAQVLATTASPRWRSRTPAHSAPASTCRTGVWTRRRSRSTRTVSGSTRSAPPAPRWRLLTPAHQFPTGVVLDGERRRELMRWAAEGGLIIEDDYDAEHRYDRPPVPALRSMLTDQVCYAGSVSKLLAPALRIGWMLAPPRYRDGWSGRQARADLGNAALPQLVLAQLMESGELERQLRLLRRRHRRRRDAMIDAIGTHLPGATVHGAAAGLHLTITFDAEFADVDLAAAALARGVKIQPLSWHCQRPQRPGLVLGYAASPPTPSRREWRRSAPS